MSVAPGTAVAPDPAAVTPAPVVAAPAADPAAIEQLTGLVTSLAEQQQQITARFDEMIAAQNPGQRRPATEEQRATAVEALVAANPALAPMAELMARSADQINQVSVQLATMQLNTELSALNGAYALPAGSDDKILDWITKNPESDLNTEEIAERIYGRGYLSQHRRTGAVPPPEPKTPKPAGARTASIVDTTSPGAGGSRPAPAPAHRDLRDVAAHINRDPAALARLVKH